CVGKSNAKGWLLEILETIKHNFQDTLCRIIIVDELTHDENVILQLQWFGLDPYVNVSEPQWHVGKMEKVNLIVNKLLIIPMISDLCPVCQTTTVYLPFGKSRQISTYPVCCKTVNGFRFA